MHLPSLTDIIDHTPHTQSNLAAKKAPSPLPSMGHPLPPSMHGQASTHTPGYFLAFSPFATKGTTFGWLDRFLGYICNRNWIVCLAVELPDMQNNRIMNVFQMTWKFVSGCAWLSALRLYWNYPIWTSSCGEKSEILAKYRFFLMNLGYMHWQGWLYAACKHGCEPQLILHLVCPNCRHEGML